MWVKFFTFLCLFLYLGQSPAVLIHQKLKGAENHKKELADSKVDAEEQEVELEEEQEFLRFSDVHIWSLATIYILPEYFIPISRIPAACIWLPEIPPPDFLS